MSDDRAEDLELDREVAARRRAVEAELARVRAAIASEVGVAPRRRGWLLLLLAGAAGLALALRRRGRRPERREGWRDERRRGGRKGRRRARRA